MLNGSFATGFPRQGQAFKTSSSPDLPRNCVRIMCRLRSSLVNPWRQGKTYSSRSHFRRSEDDSGVCARCRGTSDVDSV